MHPFDLYIGRRLRERRKALRLTQTQLAQALGISFQQVQKYEQGTNRISASRLSEAARILDIPVCWFFGGAEQLRELG